MADDNKTAAKNAAKSAAELKKQKKKKWCPIVAPEAFQNRFIGESLVDDASFLMNKSITVNLMQLSGDMKRQHINLTFKVSDVKEGKGIGQIVKYELSQSFLKRMAKRDKDKVSDSFVVKTIDNKFVRIKPVMVTNNQTRGSTLASLVRNCRAICKDIINKSTFDQLVLDLVDYKFQKYIRESLHKTYPLRNFEVKSFALESKKKKETVEEELFEQMKQKQKKKEQEKLDAAEEETGTKTQADENTEDSDESATEESDESETVDDSVSEEDKDAESREPTDESDDDTDDSKE
ncbi:MAG: hypothetical protein WC916_02450 [Candidatus Woesearchaeota archaeon]